METCTHPDVAAAQRLGNEIAELSAHIEVATARLLNLIREFDALGGWNNGFKSCAEWLSWRVGLDLHAAYERVRVARALPNLPRIAETLARGELSYSKVRALTRVATPETEDRLLAFARCGTAAHVERLVRAWRRVDRNAENREAAHQHKSRSLHVYQDEDGMFVIRGRLTPEVGAVVRQALTAACDRLYAEAPVKDPDDSPGATPGPPASRRRLPVPRLRIALHARASHPPLGQRRAHDAVEPRLTVSASSSGSSRGGLQGRTLAGRRAAVPHPTRLAPTRGPAAARGRRGCRSDLACT